MGPEEAVEMLQNQDISLLQLLLLIQCFWIYCVGLPYTSKVEPKQSGLMFTANQF